MKNKMLPCFGADPDLESIKNESERKKIKN